MDGVDRWATAPPAVTASSRKSKAVPGLFVRLARVFYQGVAIGNELYQVRKYEPFVSYVQPHLMVDQE